MVKYDGQQRKSANFPIRNLAFRTAEHRSLRMDKYALLNWFGQANYYAMQLTNNYWWWAWCVFIFTGFLIGMAPLMTHKDQSFHEIVFVWMRRSIIFLSFLLLFVPFVMLYLYDMTTHNQLADSSGNFQRWFITLAKTSWPKAVIAAILGISGRFLTRRYVVPIYSAILRKLRNNQTDEKLTDIREEKSRFEIKNFVPSKLYKNELILVGLDEKNNPVYIPASTWYETNMQIIGPTRYGKGVILGGIMEQAIMRGDTLFYIDPKNDKFAPHVMYQAAKAAGRKFYYLTLHDEGIGQWAPFAGGTVRDGLARIEIAYGLEFTGDPGTDYYKSQERMALVKNFEKTRNLESLKKLMEAEDANRINAELVRWTGVQSLCPKNGKGFSIEKALLENAVVYVQGHLDDSVIKTATKIFIVELIQEARRLASQRKAHLTAAIDEVSFLASKQLAQALATAVGFDVNFILAYQSQEDLLNIDDKTVNAKYVHQSINVNSQIKAVYGGADFDTAEWIANLSGTIVKSVTKMEKTEVSHAGGEIWENNRTIGTEAENYINTNVVLTLPPRVCVFVQPRHLATILFSSFVPVKDMSSLTEFLAQKNKQYAQNDSEPTSDDSDNNDVLNNGIDSVFFDSTQPETKNANDSENDQYSDKKDNLISLNLYRDKQDKPEKKGILGSVVHLMKSVSNSSENVIEKTEPADEKLSENENIQLETEEDIDRKNKNRERKKRQRDKKRQAQEQTTESDNSVDNSLPATHFEKLLMTAGALAVADVLLDEDEDENKQFTSENVINSTDETIISDSDSSNEINSNESFLNTESFHEINTNVALDDFSAFELTSDSETLRLLDSDDENDE